MNSPTQPASPPETPTLRRLLEQDDSFLVAVEIETTRGLAMGERGSRAALLARQLAESPGVDLLCLTDNPGGHPQIRPEVLGQELLDMGQEVVINVSCKDYNRNAIEARLWALASAGFHDVLALSGDYPTDGHAGQAQPVFDIDSVGLLAMMRQMNDGMPAPGRRAARGGVSLERTAFFPGAAVNPFKQHENELMPQLLKLALKVRTGARWAVTQMGYDSRKLDELRRYMAANGFAVPLIGSVFILSAPAARFFHRWGIPGVAVSAELLELAEQHAGSPDRGRGFFREFAAKQVAVLRGLGYRGVYLSGRPNFRHIQSILEIEQTFGPDDWKDFAREIQYPQPGEFYYFERDPASGLASDEISERYRAATTRSARLRRRLTLPASLRAGRIGHAALFGNHSPGFKAGRWLYSAVERAPAPVGALLHRAEQAAKWPIYGCRDCGDCSLPDIAYLCPESQCVKNQRNGPCGGTHAGRCEILNKECIWSRAYDRLKAHAEETRMLERPVVFKNGALQGTSAWANTFLGRDHHAALPPPAGPDSA